MLLLQVVDFSCGANAWIPEVKKTALEVRQSSVLGAVGLHVGVHPAAAHKDAEKLLDKLSFFTCCCTRLQLTGTRVSGKAFDIVTPACMEDFTLQDWFATSSSEHHMVRFADQKSCLGYCPVIWLLMPALTNTVVALGEQCLVLEAVLLSGWGDPGGAAC